jgi:hypothetical protein
LGEVVSQGFGLCTAMRRQPSAARLPPDHAMEAGVSITVANEDQAHATTLGGAAPWPVAFRCDLALADSGELDGARELWTRVALLGGRCYRRLRAG